MAKTQTKEVNGTNNSNGEENLGVFGVGRGTERRVVISEFKGKKNVHVREYFLPDGSEEYRPGKGLAVKPEQLSDLIDLLTKAQKKLAATK